MYKVKYIGEHKEVVNKCGTFKKGEEKEVSKMVLDILLKNKKEFALVAGENVIKENK